jgi:hypothetical protein
MLLDIRVCSKIYSLIGYYIALLCQEYVTTNYIFLRSVYLYIVHKRFLISCGRYFINRKKYIICIDVIADIHISIGVKLLTEHSQTRVRYNE